MENLYLQVLLGEILYSSMFDKKLNSKTSEMP